MSHKARFQEIFEKALGDAEQVSCEPEQFAAAMKLWSDSLADRGTEAADEAGINYDELQYE